MQSSSNDIYSNQVKYSALLVFLMLVAYVVYFWINEIPLFNAFNGQSPLEWTYKYFHPDFFKYDFPTLANIYDRSLFMHIYLLCYKFLAIVPQDLISIVIAVEVLMVAGAFILLTKTIYPKCNYILPLMVAIFAVASSARSIDLARFGHPLFWGLYYNFCDFLRILSFIAVFNGRLFVGAILMAAAFMTHPALGIMGFLFAIGLGWEQLRTITTTQKLLFGLIFVLLSGTWVFFFYDLKAIGDGGIDRATWYQYAQMGSYHWFVQKYWFNTTLPANRYFIGFISYVILLGFFFKSDRSLSKEFKQAFKFGVLIVIALSVIGYITSQIQLSIPVVKLALMRSTDLIAIFGLPIIVTGLIDRIKKWPWYVTVVPTFLFFSPFIGGSGYYFSPLLLVALFLITSIRIERPDSQYVIASLGVILLLVFCHYITDSFVLVLAPSYLGDLSIEHYLSSIVALIVILGSRLFSRHLNLSLILLLSLVFFGWHFTSKSGYRGEERKIALSYKDTQEWANSNTAPTDIFLIDPTITYGWRDYSHRSSFGNFREWAFSSWNYESNNLIFHEGGKRISEFDIEPGMLLSQNPSLVDFNRLLQSIGDKFYSGGFEFWQKLGNKYGLNYVVVDKDKLNSFIPNKPVFTNDKFSVYELKSKTNKFE